MRKLILSINTSLDGFVEGLNGDMSWMQPDTKETWAYGFSLFENVDLYLLGAGMWPDYSKYWDRALTEPGFTDDEVRYARLAKNTPHIVFSKQLKSSGWDNAEISAGPLYDVINEHKSKEGKDIQVVGGAKFCAAVMDTGLVDEYRLIINPAILAQGKSIYHGIKKKHKLAFIEAKPIGQLVVLRYNQVDTESAEQE